MTANRLSDLRRRAVSAFNWMFRDRQTGRITVAQFPNVALGIFFATVVVGQVADDDDLIGVAARWTGTAALAWWAVAELRSGVNPWRRLLGLAGCVIVGTRIASLMT